MKVIRPESRQPLPPHAKKVFQGVIFSVYQWEQELYDGSKTIFEKIKRRDTVGVIAVTEEGKILMTRQEQPGIATFYGSPGGIIDVNEDPFVAIQRELLEETGFVSHEWDLLDASQPTTKIDWAIYTFIARNCKEIQDMHLDPGEKLDVLELSWEEFLDYTTKKEFRDTELALRVYRESSRPGGLDDLRKKIFG